MGFVYLWAPGYPGAHKQTTLADFLAPADGATKTYLTNIST